MSRMAELWEELYGDKSIETVKFSEEMEKKYQEEVAEAYLENERRLTLTPKGEKLLDNMREEYLNMSEKERCLYYGIACSFGICDECDIAERS